MPSTRQIALVTIIAAGCFAGAGCARNRTEQDATTSELKGHADIHRDELENPSVVALNLYDAILWLRPTFFTDAGSLSRGASMMVSVNGGALRPLSALTTIATSEVEEVLYLTPGQATARFGMRGKPSPVVLVKLRGAPGAAPAADALANSPR